ncbi:hypothetical protein AB0B01_19310 [Streptomyces sp. NPDC044571]|uniref:hypothetical protein n=1 Tax=Streptomyces sp. NPDC044571 TaxID=3155371 RepID=UPI0033D3424C
MVRVRTDAALAGGALLVAALTACGSDGGAGKGDRDGGAPTAGKTAQKPAEAVRASYRKTVPAKFAKASVSTVEADGKTREETGVKDWYPFSSDTTSGGKHTVMIGDTVYSPMEKEKNGGKPWMKIELGSPDKPGVRRLRSVDRQGGPPGPGGLRPHGREGRGEDHGEVLRLRQGARRGGPPADQVTDFDAVQKETERKLKEAEDTLKGLGH